MSESISKQESNEGKVTINFNQILYIALYVFGIIAIIIAFLWYNKDLEISSGGDPFRFYEKTYVGGDAYNYIISASRSTAVMIKSLIWMVLGCSSIIAGRLFSIRSKICK